MNTEAQNILAWTRQQGITDTQLAEVTGISRETLSRIRNSNDRNKVSGSRVLPILQKVHIRGKPYTTTTPNVPLPQPRQVATQKLPSTPQRSTPQKPIRQYRIGQRFTCSRCGFPQVARAVNSYCLSCEHPYTTE